MNLPPMPVTQPRTRLWAVLLLLGFGCSNLAYGVVSPSGEPGARVPPAQVSKAPASAKKASKAPKVFGKVAKTPKKAKVASRAKTAPKARALSAATPGSEANPPGMALSMALKFAPALMMATLPEQVPAPRVGSGAPVADHAPTHPADQGTPAAYPVSGAAEQAPHPNPYMVHVAPRGVMVASAAPIPVPLPDTQARGKSETGGLGSLLPHLPMFEQAILPKIQKVYPTGEKPLVVVTFKCPTEVVGIDTPSTIILHKAVNGGMDLINRSNLLSFNMQQVCQ